MFYDLELENRKEIHLVEYDWEPHLRYKFPDESNEDAMEVMKEVDKSIPD